MTHLRHTLSKLGSYSLVVAAAVLLIGLSGCDDNDSTGTNTEMNIVETAQTNENLSSLVDALTQTKLDTTLEKNGPFTVFAPTNSAFNTFLGDSTLSDIPDNTLNTVLKYHVVADSKLTTDGLNSGDQTVTTSGGVDLTITKNDDGSVTLTDQADSTYAVTTEEIDATNGVIHIIDGVLHPLAESSSDE